MTPGVNLGLIAFAGTANVLVSPNPDHQATVKTLENLRPEDGTATGDAIFAALQAIQTVNAVLMGPATNQHRVGLQTRVEVAKTDQYQQHLGGGRHVILLQRRTYQGVRYNSHGVPSIATAIDHAAPSAKHHTERSVTASVRRHAQP